eukprot:TRINITY_DN10935_c0_g1_i1.p1 TRINITY_DN10935_c0_g1~~TRINITY_DN10935_c0_g1_i1.p1  ORF type:complete len:292 (-),score=51.41 TRINITY_DN10935_c0_g1_i1:476-1351(-)
MIHTSNFRFNCSRFTSNAQLLVPKRTAHQKKKLRIYSVKEEENKIQLGVSREELEDMALKILREDPEKSAQLDRLAAAEQRVADLVAQQKQIQDEYEQAIKQVAADEYEMEQQAKEKAADLQVQAAEKQLVVAQLELESAQLQQSKWQEEVAEDLERVESVKAGACAIAGGVLTSVPLAIVADNTILSVGSDVLSGLISCGLFGIVYRYALRQDINNVQLKGGVIAAFGITKGLAAAQQILAQSEQISTDRIAMAAFQLGSSMLLFAFAAAALEFAIQRGFVVLFGQSKED